MEGQQEASINAHFKQVQDKMKADKIKSDIKKLLV